jgi:hypothetical protein
VQVITAGHGEDAVHETQAELRIVSVLATFQALWLLLRSVRWERSQNRKRSGSPGRRQ